MSTEPLVSVVIPTYNCAPYISEAIESVLNQTYQNIEIIVVDDGSVDHTKKVLKRFIGKIKYYYQDNNGAPAARNAGLKVSSGDYFQLLDADDILLPNKIKFQIETFKKLSCEYGVVYSGVRFFNYTNSSKLMERGLHSFSGDILNKLIWENSILIHAALIKKECFEKVGGFNEDLQRCDDYEFWLRASSLGYKFYYINRVLALYRKRSDSLTTNTMAQYHYTFMVFNNAHGFINNKKARRNLHIVKLFIWFDYVLVKIGYIQQGIVACLAADIVFLWKNPTALIKKLYGRSFRFFNNLHRIPKV